MTKKSRSNNNQGKKTSATRESPKPIKILAIAIGAMILVIALTSFAFSFFASEPSTDTRASATQPLGGALAPIENGVQEVTISMQGYRYQPEPIRVLVDVPVRFTVDLSTVTGCMRSIQIPELGVSGQVSSANNVIEFTPTKTGTFRMTCSMGMGQGMIIVQDADGQAPAATATALPFAAARGGSCGMSGGGCGCGG